MSGTTCPPRRSGRTSGPGIGRPGDIGFIDVKGRVSNADRFMVTRQEIIMSLHEPEKSIPGVVEVDNDVAAGRRYVSGALDEREPLFDQAAVQFDLKRLRARAAALR